ncbi:MAG: heme-binding protein [Methanomassiliicoccales archaeon]|nr:heme-binding protein [Methanomassiliicoccales archaeon]
MNLVRSVPYEVVSHLGDAELRRYSDLLLVTVHDLADNESFGLLFQYIGGGNDKSSKIPMTAPVVSRTGEPTDPDSEGQMSFVLPTEMRMEDVPRPKDPRVMLERKKGGLFAVMRFRGRAGEDDVQKMIHDLLGELKEADHKVDGRPFLLRYNSPFTPGFMRHNEVAVRVVPRSAVQKG